MLKDPGNLDTSPAMGGSLGALPTENLLQMIGNLRLSTRLLLENPETKDFSLITFREGELVPEIESSLYLPLRELLEKNPAVDKNQLAAISATSPDTPLWNRLLTSGLVDRNLLKRYLIEGVRLTLKLFHDLSGVHFELSPVATERLGNQDGYSVTEICSLARRPASVPEPPPRKPAVEQPVPPRAETQGLAPSGGVREALTDLLRQLREAVPGVLTSYVVNTRSREVLASSTTGMLDDRPDFHMIKDRVCDIMEIKFQPPFPIKESYLYADDYLVGINNIKGELCLLTLCIKESSFGLLLTGMRKARNRACELIPGESK